MEILTFTTPLLKSNMYLLTEEVRGIILDPFMSTEFVNLISRDCTKIDYIILTHEHYDHISGTNELREQFHCPVLCSEICAERIQSPVYNLSHYEETYLTLQTGEPIPENLLPIEDYESYADDTFSGEKVMQWQGHRLVLTETPGHSPGSACILVDGDTLFSGDSLLMNNSFATRFPGRSKRQYEQITQPYLASLSPDVLVYPGHYGTFRLKDHPEWVKWNQIFEKEYRND